MCIYFLWIENLSWRFYQNRVKLWLQYPCLPRAKKWYKVWRMSIFYDESWKIMIHFSFFYNKFSNFISDALVLIKQRTLFQLQIRLRSSYFQSVYIEHPVLNRNHLHKQNTPTTVVICFNRVLLLCRALLARKARWQWCKAVGTKHETMRWHPSADSSIIGYD